MTTVITFLSRTNHLLSKISKLLKFCASVPMKRELKYKIIRKKNSISAARHCKNS